MWFIFVLPVALTSSLAALFTVTKGMNFVIFATAATEWQRRRGHRAGEGRLSERENGAYYGVGLDENSDHDLTRELGRLAHYAPTAFEPFVGKKYDFTKTEGELLRAMLSPVTQALNELEGVKIELEMVPDDEDLQQLLFAAVDNLGRLLNPVITYLEQFPKKRIKKL